MKAFFSSLRRIRKYYTRYEINTARLLYNWPPGHIVPEFGKYVEEGVTGNLPSSAGRLEFTASQSRHWIEHGTAIMERLLQRKVCLNSLTLHLRITRDAPHPPA
eukprot:6199755-Pleurochrysis_carterae.AAC.1